MNKIIAWLGRQSLFQTFEDDVECDVEEIRRILDEENKDRTQTMTKNSDIRYTGRLRLEPVGPQHADDLLRLFQDPTVEKWYGKWTSEKAKHEAVRGKRGWESDGVQKWMAYDRHSGELIGRVGLSRALVEGHNRLEIGWVLLAKHQGHGYATEIGRAGLAFAFEELGADEVASFTETRNTASRAVMERLGFHFDHEFIWPDDGIPCVLYSLKRTEWLANNNPGIGVEYA